MICTSSKRAKKKTLQITISSVIVFFTAQSAFGAAGYSLSAGASHSDNIRRSDDQSAIVDTVSNVTGAFIWSNQSPRLTMLLSGQATYLSYMEDSFEDQVVPRGTLNIDWNISPARLNWIVDDRYGQIASDPFSAFTPDDIEDTNVFSTGPNLVFGSSERQQLILSVRAEDQWYEESLVDNQRLNGGLELVRQVSEGHSIGITGFAEKVDFEDDASSTDYEIFEAFATFSRSSGTFNYALDAGVTALEIEGERADGFLGRLNLFKTTNTGWLLAASGEYSFTDSGSRFVVGRQQGTAGPGQSVDDDTLLATGSPLRLKRYSLSVDRPGDRSDLGLNVYWETEEYELDPLLDRTQAGITLDYGFQISQLNRVALRGNYRNVEFESDSREDDNLEAELRFQRTLTNNLVLTARVARLERTSTDAASQFVENVYGLILTYNSDLMGALQGQSRTSR